MMAIVVDVADAIVDLLNSGTWDQAIVAERTYLPRGTLKDGDFESVKVSVVPRNYEPDMITRSMADEDVWVDIGVQKKTDGDVAQIDPLVSLCESIATYMRGRNIGTVNPVSCYESQYSPIFVPDHLEKFGIFTGLVTVKCRTVR